MTVDLSKKEVLASLDPLFIEARAKGLWFHCYYQNLWFSPDELAAEHANGKFLWHATNWRLRAPSERIAELERAVTEATDALERFQRSLS